MPSDRFQCVHSNNFFDRAVTEFTAEFLFLSAMFYAHRCVHIMDEAIRTKRYLLKFLDRFKCSEEPLMVFNTFRQY